MFTSIFLRHSVRKVAVDIGRISVPNLNNSGASENWVPLNILIHQQLLLSYSLSLSLSLSLLVFLYCLGSVRYKNKDGAITRYHRFGVISFFD